MEGFGEGQWITQILDPFPHTPSKLERTIIKLLLIYSHAKKYSEALIERS